MFMMSVFNTASLKMSSGPGIAYCFAEGGGAFSLCMAAGVHFIVGGGRFSIQNRRQLFSRSKKKNAATFNIT